MNSLEKLIADLKDSKKLVTDEHMLAIYPDNDYGHVPLSPEQWNFVENAIQSAINRLIALNEELEGAE